MSLYLLQDESGNKIWICPACSGADDGSPMIGCDECDDWYHWYVKDLFVHLYIVGVIKCYFPTPLFWYEEKITLLKSRRQKR